MNPEFDQVLLEAQEQWMDLDGVEAVGQGEQEGKDCIVVFLSWRSPEVDQHIPETYRGVPVVVQESGPIQAGPG